MKNITHSYEIITVPDTYCAQEVATQAGLRLLSKEESDSWLDKDPTKLAAIVIQGGHAVWAIRVKTVAKNVYYKDENLFHKYLGIGGGEHE